MSPVSVEFDIEFVDLGNSQQEQTFRREMGWVVCDESRDGAKGARAVDNID